MNPMLVVMSYMRSIFGGWTTGRKSRFWVGDMWKTDVSKYDVITVYGLAPIMEKLEQKLILQAKPGTIVVSNVFQFPTLKPYKMYGAPTSLYFYKI